MRRVVVTSWLGLVAGAACQFTPGAPPQGSPTDGGPRDTTGTVIDARLIDARPIDARVCPPAPATCTAFTCAGSSSCYYRCGSSTSGKLSYPAAAAVCTDQSVGCIVTIDSQAENDCIMQETQPSFPNALVWIGWEQSSNGSEPAGGWGWRCGTSSYIAPNWGDFEPNNTGGNEDCAAMTGGGAWIDATCSGTGIYVCELP